MQAPLKLEQAYWDERNRADQYAKLLTRLADLEFVKGLSREEIVNLATQALGDDK